MELFCIPGLVRLALYMSVWLFLLLPGFMELAASETSRETMKSWLSNVEHELGDKVSAASRFPTELSNLIAAAQENDDRQAVLQAHIEVIRARSKAGRSWPDPELRLGYEEEDNSDQINRRAAIRFRLPDRADRRLLEKIAQVDIDWTQQRILKFKGEIALRVKHLYAEGVFARHRLRAGARRLDELFEQARQLEILKESGQASAVDEARLVIEELKLFRALQGDYGVLKNSVQELSTLGIDTSRAKSAIQNDGRLQLLKEQLPTNDQFVALATRNSEDTLRYQREDGMLSIRINEAKRSWLPSPSFFQLQWGNQSDSGNTGHDNEWAALAGFDIDLFDDHEEELLLAIRRETELNHKVIIKELEQRVTSGYANVQTTLTSYMQYNDISQPAISSIRKLLKESVETGANETALWKVREDLFELERELVDMQWLLVESILELESTIGQELPGGN